MKVICIKCNKQGSLSLNHYKANGHRYQYYGIQHSELANGKFLDEGITLQEKIEKNVKFAVQIGMSEAEARKMASDVLPNLKRWKN